MKLDKLKNIKESIRADVLRDGCQSRFFYLKDDAWYSLDDGCLAASSDSCYLKLSVSEAVAYHDKGSLVAWFYFGDLQFCVAIAFPKTPQKSTRDKYKRRVFEACDRAVNAYRVSHNPLTNLLAKDAFNEVLGGSLAELVSSVPVSIEAQEGTLPRAIAVLALDIDYFKQVNDTWGHFYGDQVLKTFGVRLEKVAEDITSEGVGSPVVYLGHPSGEEFLVVISANASREQFSEWASYFRSKISDEILPTEKEWASLVRDHGVGIIEPPQVQDRTITASVGVTFHTNVTPKDALSQPSAVLLERADTALYRAKAAGRNQVIFFDEILASCGRILEQDHITGVVAIDIGSNVSVTVGQEFKVFSPTFTGSKKFAVNDGRTTRTLGVYPRVESGRIVVFNVQPEVAFACFAPHEDEKIRFEVGSHLEAIPAGSIRHLLPNFSKYFPVSDEPGRSDGVHLLQEFIKTSSSGSEVPFAVVIRFSRESEFVRKYGTASLNFSLARLFRSSQSAFHTAKYVEVLDSTAVCIVGTQKAYKENMVTGFVNEMAGELPELGVLAGVFCKADRDKAKKDSFPDLIPLNAIEFARFAASELGRTLDARVRHFGYSAANEVLQAQRDLRNFKVAYADYERLKSLGVESSYIENLGGLISGALGFKKQAFEHYERAMKMTPGTLIFKSNYGVAAYRLGEIDSALDVLNKLPLSEIDKLESMHVYGYIVYCSLLAKAKKAKSGFYDDSRFMHVAKKGIELAESNGFREIDVIRGAFI